MPLDAWPRVPASGLAYRRSDAARRRAQPDGFISGLIGRLPPSGANQADVLEYQVLLDQILEDRRITPDEGAELEALASEIGITQEQARSTNEAYLLDLLCLALDDGMITDAEAQDLREVQRLLAISDDVYADLERKACDSPVRDSGLRSAQSLHGQTVCFTGSLNCCLGGHRATRSLAQQLASEAGMVIKKNVSKKLDMLVLADPDSMSGKATRARELGVRLVAEPVFWRMLGIDFE